MSVIVYADANYKGKSATLGAGRHKIDPSMNDCISSIRVPSGWKVTLFEHADYNGQYLTLDEDRWKLDDTLHDKASSLIITEPGQEHPQPAQQSSDDVFSSENGDDWFYFDDSATSS
ncbi:peptidase inhibitor family I36 protein [Streptomyces sp. NPDC023327]|uniref:peptidase inhibitor family I36 protein n=1 Tax=Streptomyces sp. NPDC023327 TaxID=3157088 RepID=UPI0033C208C4